jgi:two-component system sensor histidine kinase UhpB
MQKIEQRPVAPGERGAETGGRPTTPGSALHRRWLDLPVRWQLMFSISVISIGAVLLSIVLAVVDARERVKIEVTSSMELAQRFVRDIIKQLATEAKMDDLLEALPAQLKYVRHARILATDATGELVQIAPEERRSGSAGALLPERERAPAWFTHLVGPSVGTREVRVVLGSNTLGTVVVVGEPGDELAEVWEEVSRRAVIWLAITALMLALLYVVLGRLLNPLVGLAGGMHELEDGHYGTRLTPPPVRELAVIAERFNTLAEALEKARAENSRLYRHLIALQEDERRQVANELHDEAGPCLFGITANASSIRRLAETTAEPQASEIKSRVVEMLQISERLKTINRDLLRRLRPVELGRLSLKELIESLVSGFQRRHPEVAFDLTSGPLKRSYGEAVDLTVFRCIQEALTNAMRHGGASHLDIEIGECEDVKGANGAAPLRRLRLVVLDNGEGFEPGAPLGLGLTAMRERVRTIGGSCRIDSSPQRGTKISLLVPLRPPADERPETSQTAQSMQ